MNRIEIWASGSGSNAEVISTYFKDHPLIKVDRIMTTNPNAGVLKRAKRLGIDSAVIELSALKNGSYLTSLLDRGIDHIILAGFLKLVPSDIVEKFENRIINIHPALLPKYGGKNMYGANVHKAVIENHEKESGITIHLVNEHFDEGRILAQIHCKVESSDTVESLSGRIHRLEHRYFPIVIEDYILNQ